jgi:Prolyl oligopeptidase family
MNKRISFHELAELELNDAAIFFENETGGLGFRFLAAVEASVAQIQQHPEASPIIDQDVRSKVLRRFPYSIMYSVKRIGFEFLLSPASDVGHSTGAVGHRNLFRSLGHKFLTFPDEGHWVLKPQNSQLWYHTVLDWLDKYLQPRMDTESRR